MLFKVEMIVKLPTSLSPEDTTELLAKEKAYSQDLQREGKWRHIWRVSGQYANVSIFDVEDNTELHNILSNLPLFPFMEISVAPLCRHPSAIHEDDR